MKLHNVAEKAAAYLVASTEFRERGYTVLSNVRVKDVLLNGAALQGDQIVDLLVCDGIRVLVGIACRPETAKLFNLNMRGLPYVQIPEVDTTLPLSADDDGWLDFPSEACLESLLKSVMLSLSCVRYRQGHRSLASYRKQAVWPQTEGKIYSLLAVPPEQMIDRKPPNALRLYEKMAAKQLLRSDFTPTPYGNSHGLFLRYHVNPFGDVCSELLTVPGAVKDIRDVLSWHPGQTDRARKIPLAERVKYIGSRSADGDCNVLSAIKKLLNTPVDILFPNRGDDLQRLLSTMNYSRLLLYGERAAREPADTMPVYREVLETIHSLRQGFSDDPLLDDDRSYHMRRSCETLLLLLSEVFLTPRNAEPVVPKGKMFVKKQSLKERLAEVPGQSEFALFGITLASYYQAISRLSECEYPNWVYRSRILPILKDSGKPETDFNLRFLAAYCKVCREDNGAHDWDETLPLLFDLIAIPACIKKQQRKHF